MSPDLSLSHAWDSSTPSQSATTLTTAGLPEASARFIAGTRSSDRSTYSPWAPRASMARSQRLFLPTDQSMFG